MKHFKNLVKPYFVWSLLLIVIPLVLIVIYAFTNSGNEVRTLNFTLSNFARFLEPTYLNVFLKSFRLGLITTGICLITGYPLAFIITRFTDKVQDLLILLVTIPMWINMLLLSLIHILLVLPTVKSHIREIIRKTVKEPNITTAAQLE